MAPPDELIAHAIAHEVRNLLTPARGYIQLGQPEAALQAMDRALAFADAVLGGGDPACDVAEVVRECGGVARGTAWATIDSSVLRQVIANLSLNATQAGARPTISSEDSPGGCAITVEDNGPGLPADIRPSRGRGKGLKICKFLVEQAGGDLVINSTPGCGTTVRIELPAAIPARQAA